MTDRPLDQLVAAALEDADLAPGVDWAGLAEGAPQDLYGQHTGAPVALAARLSVAVRVTFPANAVPPEAAAAVDTVLEAAARMELAVQSLGAVMAAACAPEQPGDSTAEEEPQGPPQPEWLKQAMAAGSAHRARRSAGRDEG